MFQGGELEVRRAYCASVGGVTLQIVRGGFSSSTPGVGWLDRLKSAWQEPGLNDAHRDALASVIDSGPIPAVHGIMVADRR